MKSLRYSRLVNQKISVFIVIFFGLMTLFCSPLVGASGTYLVATQAGGKNDFEAALKNYSLLLKRGIFEAPIVQESLLFAVLSNDLEAVHNLSKIVEEQGIKIPTLGLISLVKYYKNKDFKKAQSVLSEYQKSLPAYLITISNGWIEIANGSLTQGIEIFSSLDGSSRYLGLYNCAVAFALVGEFQRALLYVEQLEESKLKFDEMQVRALAQIYSRNNMNDKAVELIETQSQNKTYNVFEKVLLDLKLGKTLNFTAFSTSTDALSNVFYLMGTTKGTKKNLVASSFYIQLAQFLAVKKDYYHLRLAEIFADMQVFNHSIKKFDKLDRESAFYLRAQLGLANTLVMAGNRDLAQKILEKLIEEGFTKFIVFDSLADIFRSNEDYHKAILYYNMALSNISKEAKRTKWATVFVRGISYDQSGNWEEAKVDLKSALELSSDHPEVLNYFGYSLIERNENLEQALKMIENAVSQRPDSGHIVDSLAWGLYRLGYYKEAIAPMERAIQLEPHDPIVNDHLGDILWMVGRKREASFQWQRALLFGPTDENEEKIKEKLIFGITDL